MKINKKTFLLIACFQAGSVWAAEFGVMPTVTVYGNYVSYWNPTWYAPDYGGFGAGVEYTGGGGPGNVGYAIASARERAFNMSNVCNAPVSPGARATTANSDVTSRWLAAQEVFNVIQSRNLYPLYQQSINSLSFLMNGVKYSGFKITYSDGARETWAINPGFRTSSVKLLDQPLPNSLKPGAEAGCNP
jgi:hypothetical protein